MLDLDRSLSDCNFDQLGGAPPHMAPSAHRFIAGTATSLNSDRSEVKKDLWSSLLDSVATGRKLPEKTIIVLGTLAGSAGRAL